MCYSETIKSKSNTFWIGISFSIVLLGLAFRLRQYFVGRSLWLDEAMLALNIANRSYIELLRPLDYAQGAPIGFLFVQKFVIQVLGNRDYVLRLVPLFSGIMVLFLMIRVATRYISLRGSGVVLGLLAVSSPLIYYASEAKQYSSDAMISLLLLLLVYNCINENAQVKDFIILGFSGGVSLFMSHPALFILAGIGFCLLLDAIFRKDKSRFLLLVYIYFFWLVSFCVLFLVSLRFLSVNKTLLNYWNSSFMPMPPWNNVEWFRTTFLEMLKLPVGLTNTLLGTIFFFMGCLSFFLRSWRTALIVIIPFFLTLVASGLEKYPFQGRLLLFMVPLVCLLIGEGLDQLYLFLSRHNILVATGVWIGLVLLLVYKPVEIAFQNFNQPNFVEHIKPIMVYLSQHRRPTDSVYVYYGAEAAFEYYAPLYGLERGDYNIGVKSRNNPVFYIQDIEKFSGKERVWYLFSHNCGWCEVDEKLYILEHLNKVGIKIEEIEAPGASIYLYDLRPLQPQDDSNLNSGSIQTVHFGDNSLMDF